ncbi:tetratricopeptide repeat protein [Rufibacter aurantiacus]|uniref:tetratricopeptide repeat protein n=1 Tax=Rufibacter aurantiacus TaxID=2817374 RepID=UPI001B30EA54|nr:tetratricopeptide repeat protein [Rufibacter aurantiacus]
MQRIKVVVSMLVLVMASLQASALNLQLSSGAGTRIKELTQLIKQQPGNVQAYGERAAARMEARDVYGAIKDYTFALTLSEEDNQTYLLGRGNAYLEIGAYKEALRDFDAILMNGNSTDALYGRAVGKYYLDDFFGAIRDLDEVVAVAPQHSKALCNRGIVKLELNQLEDSVTDLTLFLTHYPDHQEATYALQVATSKLQRRTAKR